MGLQAVDDMAVSFDQLLQLAILLAPDVDMAAVGPTHYILVCHTHEGNALHSL